MDIKACENNTNPTSRDFEKYLQGVDHYIENLIKQINFLFALTCFEAISSKTLELNENTIEIAFNSTKTAVSPHS